MQHDLSHNIPKLKNKNEKKEKMFSKRTTQWSRFEF
jgi:hypothetical protein